MRARALAAEEQETAEDGQRSDVPAVEAEPELDLGTLNEQTLRIVRAVLGLAFLVGVYMLSTDLLPALEHLGQSELWSVTTATGVRQITLQSLLTSGTILFLAVLGFRNLSGFLEFALLSRVSVDRGLRFAIITISQYLIVVFAVITAFNVLGVGWSKVQWLIAALSVGLGFGLQEIFANFVSGIVLLLERPIRVGDIVTVDNISGRVTKIRMRATTVMDFDRRELVVPNRSFITGNLINWTLTDPVMRTRIVVGVAYGSDTAKVEQLLLTAARKHPTVLGDPKPQVIFHDFGDSALTFWLHVFIPHRDVLLDVLHDLHMAIDQAFREAGIVIAFPQRDLHIDGSSPLDVRVVGGPEER
jgi:potassium efflux system protein